MDKLPSRKSVLIYTTIEQSLTVQLYFLWVLFPSFLNQIASPKLLALALATSSQNTTTIFSFSATGSPSIESVTER